MTCRARVPLLNRKFQLIVSLCAFLIYVGLGSNEACAVGESHSDGCNDEMLRRNDAQKFLQWQIQDTNYAPAMTEQLWSEIVQFILTKDSTMRKDLDIIRDYLSTGNFHYARERYENAFTRLSELYPKSEQARYSVAYSALRHSVLQLFFRERERVKSIYERQGLTFDPTLIKTNHLAILNDEKLLLGLNVLLVMHVNEIVIAAFRRARAMDLENPQYRRQLGVTRDDLQSVALGEIQTPTFLPNGEISLYAGNFSGFYKAAFITKTTSTWLQFEMYVRTALNFAMSNTFIRPERRYHDSQLAVPGDLEDLAGQISASYLVRTNHQAVISGLIMIHDEPAAELILREKMALLRLKVGQIKNVEERRILFEILRTFESFKHREDLRQLSASQFGRLVNKTVCDNEIRLAYDQGGLQQKYERNYRNKVLGLYRNALISLVRALKYLPEFED